jgi:hypothetical protein
LARLVTPPTCFHATHRDLGLGVGGYQNAGIQNPVLLGSNQFLAFEKEDTKIATVFDRQVGNGTCFGYLFDGDNALVEGLVRQVVIHTVGWLGEEWKDSQTLKADRITHSDFGKCKRHGWLLEKSSHRWKDAASSRKVRTDVALVMSSVAASPNLTVAYHFLP